MDIVIVKTSAACASKYGKYANLGVVELAPGYQPHQIRGISERYTAVKRVICKFERLHMGKTDRCEYGRKLAELRAEYPDASFVTAGLWRPQ